MTISQSNNPVAKNISIIIEKSGLKQCSVAEKAGYKTQDFNNMLNGRRAIKASDIIPIANVLNVLPNDLFRQNSV